MDSLVAWVRVTRKRQLRVVDVEASSNPEVVELLRDLRRPRPGAAQRRPRRREARRKGDGGSDRGAHPAVCGATTTASSRSACRLSGRAQARGDRRPWCGLSRRSSDLPGQIGRRGPPHAPVPTRPALKGVCGGPAAGTRFPCDTAPRTRSRAGVDARTLRRGRQPGLCGSRWSRPSCSERPTSRCSPFSSAWSPSPPGTEGSGQGWPRSQPAGSAAGGCCSSLRPCSRLPPTRTSRAGLSGSQPRA